MTAKETILLTGGAGYCGSHTYAALAAAGYHAVILDDFSNARKEVITRLAQLTGAPVPVAEANVLDKAALAKVFAEHSIAGVIHFAAKKAVGESVKQPLAYFDSNIGGLTALLQAMASAGVFRLVFSSSATVYGEPAQLPVAETAPRSYNNPYGFTKLICEQMLEQLAQADPRWRVGILRYFNPVGAHPSGLIGEDPAGIPANLMPRIAQVAARAAARAGAKTAAGAGGKAGEGGDAETLKVFGGDYDTPDGTAIRDYIHVGDLAEGHVRCLAALTADAMPAPAAPVPTKAAAPSKASASPTQASAAPSAPPNVLTLNLGTGRGCTVLEVINAFERACGKPIPHQITARRPGDAPATYADASLAEQVLGFKAESTLDDMCRSSWQWICNSAAEPAANPNPNAANPNPNAANANAANANASERPHA